MVAAPAHAPVPAHRGLVVLLAVSCAAVGVAAVLELNGFLTGRLDQQLRDAGASFPASLEHGSSVKPSDHDGDEYGDTRRQATGTFGARLLDGTVTNEAVVRAGTDPADLNVVLTATDRKVLAAVPVDSDGHSVRLSALGSYRLTAWNGQDGDVLITGLPWNRWRPPCTASNWSPPASSAPPSRSRESPEPCGCAGRCGR